MEAEAALTHFFDYLDSGDYQEAADLYGGSYLELQAMNPLLPLKDHESLWRAACTINGYQCLAVITRTYSAKSLIG